MRPAVPQLNLLCRCAMFEASSATVTIAVQMCPVEASSTTVTLAVQMSLV